MDGNTPAKNWPDLTQELPSGTTTVLPTGLCVLKSMGIDPTSVHPEANPHHWRHPVFFLDAKPNGEGVVNFEPYSFSLFGFRDGPYTDGQIESAFIRVAQDEWQSWVTGPVMMENHHKDLSQEVSIKGDELTAAIAKADVNDNDYDTAVKLSLGLPTEAVQSNTATIDLTTGKIKPSTTLQSNSRGNPALQDKANQLASRAFNCFKPGS